MRGDFSLDLWHLAVVLADIKGDSEKRGLKSCP